MSSCYFRSLSFFIECKNCFILIFLLFCFKINCLVFRSMKWCTRDTLYENIRIQNQRKQILVRLPAIILISMRLTLVKYWQKTAHQTTNASHYEKKKNNESSDTTLLVFRCIFELSVCFRCLSFHRIASIVNKVENDEKFENVFSMLLWKRCVDKQTAYFLEHFKFCSILWFMCWTPTGEKKKREIERRKNYIGPDGQSIMSE